MKVFDVEKKISLDYIDYDIKEKNIEIIRNYFSIENLKKQLEKIFK